MTARGDGPIENSRIDIRRTFTYGVHRFRSPVDGLFLLLLFLFLLLLLLLLLLQP